MKLLLFSIIAISMIGLFPLGNGLTDEEWKEEIRRLEIEETATKNMKSKLLELEFLHKELEKEIMEQTHRLMYDAPNKYASTEIQSANQLISGKYVDSWDDLNEAEEAWFESDGLLIFARVQVENNSYEAENTLSKIEQNLKKVHRLLVTSERLWYEGKTYDHPGMNLDGTTNLWIPRASAASDIITHTNQKYDFQLQYPNNWELFEPYSVFENMETVLEMTNYDGDVVSIYREKDILTAPMNPSFLQQQANGIFERNSIDCRSYTFEKDGFVCYDLELVGYENGYIGDIKTVDVLLTYTAEDSDYYYYYQSFIRTWTDPVDSHYWQLVADTLQGQNANSEVFDIVNSITLDRPTTKQNVESSHYVNSKYGFSFTPPKGWLVENFEDLPEIDIKSVEGMSLQPMVRYTYPHSNANFVVPTMFVMAKNLGMEMNWDDLDMDDSDEQMLAGFLNGLESVGGQGKLLSTNTEKISGGLHFDGKAEISFDVGLQKLIPAKMDFHAWMFEDGLLVYYLYMAESSDYGKFGNEFQKSANTFSYKPQITEKPQQISEGGGCLIATAAYGSELAPQVQVLRELRDNTVLQTTSGTTFMNTFNQFYYSFSPYVADYERENPIFKEAVKVSLTPLLTSLTLLNYVEIDSEEEMLGYGIGIILLNIGMYFVAPAVLIISLKKRLDSFRGQ